MPQGKILGRRGRGRFQREEYDHVWSSPLPLLGLLFRHSTSSLRREATAGRFAESMPVGAHSPARALF